MSGSRAHATFNGELPVACLSTEQTDPTQTKVGELNHNFTLLGTIRMRVPSVSDNEIFRLDISMVDALIVTSCYGVTHLGKHGRNETKPSAGKLLRGIHVGKETRSRGSTR